MANTTWSTSDKAVNCTLSGGNLTATAASALAWARTADRQVTGKFYWEVIATTFVSVSSSLGIANATVNLTNGFSTPTLSIGTCGVLRSGSIQTDGNSTGISLGTIAGGTVCFAVDASARLIWFRLGAAGNWNNSASANPATGSGGILHSLGNGIPIYPAVLVSNTSDAVTANFGDTAFTGAVPSGFTSGFTAGASIPTNALATQIAAEHWFSTNPDMQLTQVAVEQWAAVSTVNPQLVMTQVALEQWASVASAPVGGAPQARVMIMA